MQSCHKRPRLRGVSVWRSKLGKVIASPVDIKAAMQAIAVGRMSRERMGGCGGLGGWKKTWLLRDLKRPPHIYFRARARQFCIQEGPGKLAHTVRPPRQC